MAKTKIQYPVNYTLLGKRIQQARNRNGLTQEVVAERMDISKEYLSRIENGHVKFNLVTLYKLSAVIGELPENIIAGTSVPVSDTIGEKFSEILAKCSQEKLDMIYHFAKDIAKL